jgi:hypothetical protein
MTAGVIPAAMMGNQHLAAALPVAFFAASERGARHRSIGERMRRNAVGREVEDGGEKVRIDTLTWRCLSREKLYFVTPA